MSYSSQLGYIVKDVAVNNIESVGGSREAGSSANALAGVISASTTLTAADSGSTFLITATANAIVSLPAPQAGLRFRFVIQTVPGGNFTFRVTSTGANMIIHRHSTDLTVGAGVAAQTSLILGAAGANGASVGDWIEVWGISSTLYFAKASATLTGDMTNA